MKEIFMPEELKSLSCCTLCPRECQIDRFAGGNGYCGADTGMNIASICVHRGEEPVISGPAGICNIFFSGCNLNCIFCQNHEISKPDNIYTGSFFSFEETLESVEKIISSGIKSVGFVSPSHVVPQMKAIIRGLHEKGLRPVFVYNTNGYDKSDVIDSLEGLIDVYLPDFKYATHEIAKEFSDVSDYPDVAIKALKRMYYQKGSTLLVDDEERAVSGLLIRHLVLPGHAEESKKVLRIIAEELSTGVHISLMSQYHPSPGVLSHSDLGRSLYFSEYSEVAEEMQRLGFRNGWLQEMESNLNYRPDFSKEHPFE
jgi:putative pyruvate formate lyase activating enzyme